MQLYAITDRRQLPTEGRLLELAQAWAAAGVDYIQLREKDLDAPQLETLAFQVSEKIGGSRTKLLVNIATPEAAAIALGAGARGVHLAGQPAPGAVSKVRQVFRDAIISMPCHSLKEVEMAREEGADLLLFSPIFEKYAVQPQGLESLRQVCVASRGIPVFALGGVTSMNAAACVAAGAAGVAGIRLFAGDEWRRLTSCSEPSLTNDI